MDLLEAGRAATELAHGLDISTQTVYTWRRQDRIDRGLEPGLTSGEKAELAVARRRIAELETELQATRRAIKPVRGSSADRSPPDRSTGCGPSVRASRTPIPAWSPFLRASATSRPSW
ncbi:hypothetical protein E1295_30305 [Nonomuraea mesophila]|uniref:Uncharacterized protein n=1 Tax=Nonomuraea mesophila TaxID=2530382 RepID=A0A4V6PGB1_9ACTN|nr:hypothetical protein E1295_30305 [Nonomuraea mesophila]